MYGTNFKLACLQTLIVCDVEECDVEECSSALRPSGRRDGGKLKNVVCNVPLIAMNLRVKEITWP